MLVWGRGVGSGVEEAIITLSWGQELGGRRKWLPLDKYIYAIRWGKEKEGENLVFELITDVLVFQGL